MTKEYKIDSSLYWQNTRSYCAFSKYLHLPHQIISNQESQRLYLSYICLRLLDSAFALQVFHRSRTIAVRELSGRKKQVSDPKALHEKYHGHGCPQSSH